MEPLYDRMRRVNDLRKDDVKHRQHRLAEKSKTKLIQIIEKKFQTTFIGALSAIEEYFGQLWGHDKSTSARTVSEREWYDKFQELRAKILDNGNNQARAVVNELQQYLINWQGYNMNLSVRKEQDDGR